MIQILQNSDLLLKIIVFLLALHKVFGEKSLFDEVPLNGALLPSDLDYHSLPSETFTTKLPPDPTKSPSSERKHYRKQPVSGLEFDGGNDGESSLFDQLPNQGAFPDQHPQGSGTSTNKIRTPRDSVDFEVMKINPSSDFDIPYWDKQFLAPIVNSIASRHPPIPPPNHHDNGISRFPFLNFNHNRGPPFPHFPQSPKNIYGPPRRQHNQYGNHHQQNHHQQWNQNQPIQPIPVKLEDDPNTGQNANKSLHVSANSGGPTVIVYTHPKKDFSHSSNQQDSSSWTSTEAPTKNEIHYHYHMQNEQDSRPKPPPPYGRYPFPPKRRYGPPKHSYGPPPPPPPPPQKGGGYPPSVTVQSNTYRTESSKGSSQVNVNSFNDEGQEGEDDFSQRTFITKSRTSASSYNPAVSDLSTSYEVPPAFNAPSSTYAVPPPSSKYGPGHKEPESSYGPPIISPPAPPPLPLSDPGGDQYETTITLQTIPVTRQVTELVQVPNVVHKISSNRPHQVEQAQAQLDDYGTSQQLPTSYGPPAPPPSRSAITTAPSRVNGLRENERPFETHLSQILGLSSNSQTQGQGQLTSSHNNPALLQELLLSQSRNPGYDLTLSDLELLSLLQASKGGGGGSSVGILQPQSSRSNLYGGLLGRSQFPVSSMGLINSNNGGGGWGSGSNDGLSSFREAFREQRLQIALQDLRKQLRDQNRDNQRERSGVRNLFTKGAMLLSALTLLPTMMNPMAAAAGFGSASGSAAAAASATIPNFMLPLSAAGRGVLGRRKRSLEQQRSGDERSRSFEICWRNHAVFNRTGDNDATGLKLYCYRNWLHCSATNLNLVMSKTKLKKIDPSEVQNKRFTQRRSMNISKSKRDLKIVSDCLRGDFYKGFNSNKDCKLNIQQAFIVCKI